jgi:hypothetical protein
MENECNHHILFETGIALRDVYSPVVYHYYQIPNGVIFRYWILKEKLSAKNRKFNRILNIIVQSLIIVLAILLLKVTLSIIMLFVPQDFLFIFGFMYGVLVYGICITINYSIKDLHIIINYYYKHRKFRKR